MFYFDIILYLLFKGCVMFIRYGIFRRVCFFNLRLFHAFCGLLGVAVGDCDIGILSGLVIGFGILG
jgi:hypothetical protein